MLLLVLYSEVVYEALIVMVSSSRKSKYIEWFQLILSYHIHLARDSENFPDDLC